MHQHYSRLSAGPEDAAGAQFSNYANSPFDKFSQDYAGSMASYAGSVVSGDAGGRPQAGDNLKYSSFRASSIHVGPSQSKSMRPQEVGVTRFICMVHGLLVTPAGCAPGSTLYAPRTHAYLHYARRHPIQLCIMCALVHNTNSIRPHKQHASRSRPLHV